VEQLIEALKARWRAVSTVIKPYLRQMLRIAALPYCYSYQVDWTSCTRSRLGVAWDLIYIFVKYGYYPDNYGQCRLYDRPRSQWKYYFGSGYNPFQRALLEKSIQPAKYHVLFEDKEVCQQICQGSGLPVPRLVAVLPPQETVASLLNRIQSEVQSRQLIMKPVSGLGGAGILVAQLGESGWRLVDKHGRVLSREPRRSERYVVQEFIEQHPDLAAVYGQSVNSLRVITMRSTSEEVIVLGAILRFGRQGNVVDNTSSGGVAMPIDLDTGLPCGPVHDKKGRIVQRHPDSGFEFASFRLPLGDEVIELAVRTQSAFPYYRMLGLDIAIGRNGPILVEINAFPDIVAFEAHVGPLLSNDRVLQQFAAYGVLTRSMRRALATDIARVAGDERVHWGESCPGS
jgi:glutathione synthase/RimK-type ligase-like ATP-grasp enzyme